MKLYKSFSPIPKGSASHKTKGYHMVCIVMPDWVSAGVYYSIQNFNAFRLILTLVLIILRVPIIHDSFPFSVDRISEPRSIAISFQAWTAAYVPFSGPVSAFATEVLTK